MTVYVRAYTATVVTPGGVSYPLKVKSGYVLLNEAAAPYVQGSLTVARPTMTVMAALDPTVKTRVRVVATSNAQTRSFDLLLSARQLDSATGEVGLNIVSDERLLMDFAPAANVSFKTYQSSIRSIVRYVVSVAASGTLSGSTPDKTFPTFSSVQNLLPSGSGEYGVGPWQATNATVTTSTNFHQLGAFSLQVLPQNSSNDSFAFVDPSLTPGKTYTARGFVRVAVAQGNTFPLRARGISIMVEDATGQRILASSNQGTNTSDTTSVVSLTFTVPENVRASHVRLYAGSATNGGGAAVYWDAVTLVEGYGADTSGQPLAYFDGDTVSTGYTYKWDGDPGISSSTRTPLVSRDAELLTWSTGVPAMDFLRTLLDASGLRLFCDETRTWRLVDNSFSVDGVVHLDRGVNLYAHTDLVSRTATQPDGTPLLIDAVFVRYTWTDAFGVEQTATDQAAPAGYTRPYVIEKDTAYPGPGEAAYLLSRYAARRRQQAAQGAIDLTVTPGQQVSISAPMAETQTGYLDAVNFDFGADEMTVITKNLVSTPATAWNQLASGIAWSASPVGASWASETA